MSWDDDGQVNGADRWRRDRSLNGRGPDPLGVDSWEQDSEDMGGVADFTVEQRAYLDGLLEGRVRGAGAGGFVARRRERRVLRGLRRREAAQVFIENAMPADVESDFDLDTIVGRASQRLSDSRWWGPFLSVEMLVVMVGWAGVIYARPPLLLALVLIVSL